MKNPQEDFRGIHTPEPKGTASAINPGQPHTGQVRTVFSEDDFEPTKGAPASPQIKWSPDLPRVRFLENRPSSRTGAPGGPRGSLEEKTCLWFPITQILPTVLPADLTRVTMPLGQRSQHCKPEEGTLEEVPAAESPSPPQSPQRASSSATAMDSILGSLLDEGSSSQEEEGPSTLPHLADPESFLQDMLHDKIIDLVYLLLHKYQVKKPITKAEMLESVIKNYEEYFPEIFRQASECMKLLFGIEVKELDHASHSYFLVTCLSLSYDGILSDEHSMPKSGLLIIVLSIIFMEGNCASEKAMWEVLSIMGVYAGREHFLFGEPEKLLTQDWVEENYLVYRQVPGRDPACYEFLWGPRAHAETSKMKVLEYIANASGRDPTSYPSLYEEALRVEREGV
ncbi:Melanoma-associated antigen 11 [Plecturocebus cupreus]